LHPCHFRKESNFAHLHALWGRGKYEYTTASFGYQLEFLHVCAHTSEAPWDQVSLESFVGEEGGLGCANLDGVGDRVELELKVWVRKPRIMVQLMKFSVILRLSSRRHYRDER
jgi:hypothetical protein